MASHEVNPYAAPVDDEGGNDPPEHHGPYRVASLAQRMSAALVDRLFVVVGSVFGWLWMMAQGWLPFDEETLEVTSPTLWMMIPAFVLVGIQSALMSATGQSPGERLFLIKIVMAETGAPARLVHGRPGERA